MKDPFLHEDDEVQQLKEWWRNYGAAIVIGVALGAALLGGFRYWASYTGERAAKASVQYDLMAFEHRLKKSDSALILGEGILRDYAATPYAGMAALLMARMAFESHQDEVARKHLEWAMNNATLKDVRHTARLRLARLMQQKGEISGALSLIDREPDDGFKAEYLELKGDLLHASGDIEGARKAFMEAVVILAGAHDDNDAKRYLGILQMKLADVGVPEKHAAENIQ